MKKKLLNVLAFLSFGALIIPAFAVIAEETSSEAPETSVEVESSESSESVESAPSDSGSSSGEASASDEESGSTLATSQESGSLLEVATGDEVEESDLQKYFKEAVRKFKEEYPGAEILTIDVKKIEKLENMVAYTFDVDGADAEMEYDFEYHVDENGKGTVQKSQETKLDVEDQDIAARAALTLEDYLTIDEFNAVIEKENADANVHEWTIDRDDDANYQAVWAAEYKDGTDKFDIEVDAENGKVIRLEKDN